MDTMKEKWLARAAALTPKLFYDKIQPQRVVRPERQATAFQGWRMADVESPEEAYRRLWERDEEIVFDFGRYCVGYLSFIVETVGNVDCPLWLQVKLGEVPAEIGEDFLTYQGSLGRGWLQEETINLEEPHGVIRLARRYAFRYVKFSTRDNADGYRIRLKDVSCKTVTSADTGRVLPLPEEIPPSLREIDRISLNTLKNCMQTVFEDGPKRDRRLWLGDLRLQALVNYHSFKNYDLCRRCLYLFAGLSDERGIVSSCLYESPCPRQGESFIYDYTALFAVILLEYVEATDDQATAAELWPVAVRQLEIVLNEIDDGGLFHDRGNWWLFIDWEKRLDRQAAEQGVVIFGLKHGVRLARMLGHFAEAEAWEKQVEKMGRAAVEKLWDHRRQCFVSGPEKQVSWASQIWMTLAGVRPEKLSAQALLNVIEDPAAIRPSGPYLYHYAVEALFSGGMYAAAYALLEKYWGPMVQLGADNFWEVFDPRDQYLSPYGSLLINSYCHAWSCTPAYFLRRGLPFHHRPEKESASAVRSSAAAVSCG